VCSFRAKCIHRDRALTPSSARLGAPPQAGRHFCLWVGQLKFQRVATDAVAGKLIRVRGIGPTFASMLTHEVYYRSFDNRRQVGSYLGLVSIPWQSGGVRRDQGITRSGNARARRCAIELAWLWLRHQPGSALACWYRTRVGTMTGRMRRIALVALARKLIVALWRYLQNGIVPEGAVLKAA
jgi:transposase